MPSLFNVPASDPASGADKPVAKIQGVLERITFRNEENGYTVGRLLPDGARDVVTVIGTFTHPVIGEMLICYGHWTRHPQWGAQMSVVRYETIRPATASAIEKYLGSGMVKGVGPVTAKRIVATFGERALDIIEQTPDELLKVPGLGSKTLNLIKSAWTEQSHVRNVMVFLQSHGISPTYAAKIYKKYAERSIETVEHNPYQLAADIWGIGFKSADTIAKNMGFAEDDPRRLEAGLIYVLNQAVESGGNVFLTRDELQRESEKILGPFAIGDALDSLIDSGKLIQEGLTTRGSVELGIYTPELYRAEQSLAKRLRELIGNPVYVQPRKQPLPGIAAMTAPVKLSDEQEAAVDLALCSRVMTLTGGPGVGKTTTTNAIVRAFVAQSKTVLLASPTGRAAKRLSEVTGSTATTVHRLLAYDPQKGVFQRNAESPIECDVLLVDECSMLDTPLANSLMNATQNSTQVIFVGDVDQLPSVGPGNVLGDMIASGEIPVARLTKVFRQAAESLIISGAHAINAGRMPRLASPREPGADFVFIEVDEAEEIAGKVVAIVVRSLASRGYASSDIQVLAPMQRGSAGSAYLNERLQEAVNPPSPAKPEVRRGMRHFRLGDRVIQLRNNYDKLVYNGDIGAVTVIDTAEMSAKVTFDGREVSYDYADLDELSLAYSLSIHKSQGSEFPAAIITLHTQHYALLQRNLIYTALTRAKKIAVLVGSKKALAIAVHNDKQSTRHTRLKERLTGVLV
jgi:exodeoxyribonuclease V alpha subunit